MFSCYSIRLIVQNPLVVLANMLAVVFVCVILTKTSEGLENGFSTMGTKTAYQNVLMENFPSGDTLKGSYNSKPWRKLCHPIHYSLISRHGNRYPSKGNMRMIQKFVDEIREKVNDEFDFIRTWDLPFTLDQAKLLTKVGWKDSEEMGKRMGWRWHAVYHDDVEEKSEDDDEKKLHNLNVKFISSELQRCVETARAFGKGFTAALHRPPGEEINIEIDNRLMRFYDECEKYQHTVDNNKTALHELYKYTTGPKMSGIAQKLKEKLGLQNYETMLDQESKVVVWYIFVMCGAETTLMGVKSKWCDLLDDEDAKVLEYKSDIKHYWKNAYGYPITTLQSCPLVKDIFYHLDLAVIGRTMKREYHRGVFRFGHAETLYPLYAAMGLFNVSAHLRADNHEEMLNRAFRSSRINPFSANIAFVLYDCDNSKASMDLHGLTEQDIETLPKHFEKFMIQLLVNEKSDTLPICKHELCPYSLVKHHYRPLVDSCDFDEVCRMPKSRKGADSLVKDEL